MKSLIQDNENICYMCGRYISNNRDKHHIFNGNSYRGKSEEDRLFIFLHHCCHMRLHEQPRSMRTFKQRGQRAFEEHIGTREDFIKRYGKNYLENDNDD